MSNLDFGGPPGTNPPRHQLSPRQRKPSYAGWVAGTILAAVLIVGGLMYFAQDVRQMPTTTGQSTGQQTPRPTAPLTPKTLPAPQR